MGTNSCKKCSGSEVIIMKRQVLVGLFVSVCCIIFIGVAIMLFNLNRINTSTIINGMAIYEYNSIKISEELTEDDLKSVMAIFDNKKLYYGKPSCGFNERIAVVLDDTHVFCIACDDCPIIFYKNKEMYFNLSNQENRVLRDLLTQYGFCFPCV